MSAILADADYIKYMPHETKSLEPTPFEKFRQFSQKVISVPKAEIDRREAEYKKMRALKKKAKG